MADPEMDGKRRRVEVLASRPRTRSALRVAHRLQRWWRKWRRMVPTNNTEETHTRWRVRAGGRDVRCPISQDTIELPMCFRFITASGHVIAFSVDALAAYLRSSGRFRCPCTQESFNGVVVSRIERRAVAAGAPERGLRGVYEMRSAIAYREIEHANRLLAYENSCGADLNEALDICSDFDLTRDRAQRYLLRDVLPSWRQTCMDYMRLSRTACHVMLRGDAERLRRLSSVEDADVHGLLHIVIDAVDERLRACENLSESRASASLFELASAAVSAREEMVLRDWLLEDLNRANRVIGVGGGRSGTAVGLGGYGTVNTDGFGSSMFDNSAFGASFGIRTGPFGSLGTLGALGSVADVLGPARPDRPLLAAQGISGQGIAGLQFSSFGISPMGPLSGLLGIRTSGGPQQRAPGAGRGADARAGTGSSSSRSSGDVGASGGASGGGNGS